jgi:hypothetical protein
MNSNPPLDDLYVCQKKTYVVELCNQTMLETSFEFKLVKPLTSILIVCIRLGLYSR